MRGDSWLLSRSQGRGDCVLATVLQTQTLAGSVTLPLWNWQAVPSPYYLPKFLDAEGRNSSHFIFILIRVPP